MPMQTLSPAVKEVARMPFEGLIVKKTSSAGGGVSASGGAGGGRGRTDGTEDLVNLADGGFCGEVDGSVEVGDLEGGVSRVALVRAE